MFGIFKKTETHEISGKEVLSHLQLLQRTEDEIHQYSKWDDKSAVKTKAEQRDKIARELANEFGQLEADINAKTGGKGVENKEHFNKVKEYLVKIEQILKQQLDELNQEKILNDNMLRTGAIHGDLKDEKGNDTDSHLTNQLKELSELLTKQSEIVAKYIVEVSNETKELRADNKEYVFFYVQRMPDALDNALKSVVEEFVLTLPEILVAKINVGRDHHLWQNWVTAYTEENIGIDKNGLHYKKGTAVLITVHGGGLLTPQRIRQAYDNGLINGSAKYTQEEFDTLLSGQLPTGEKIKIFKYEQIEKGVENLPHRYAIVTTYDLVKDLKSGYYKREQFVSNPLAISRAGGKELLGKYHDLAKRSDEDLGCYHPFSGRDPSQPQGRLLFVDFTDYGLGGSNDLVNYGRFVGVAPKAHDSPSR